MFTLYGCYNAINGNDIYEIKFGVSSYKFHYGFIRLNLKGFSVISDSSCFTSLNSQTLEINFVTANFKVCVLKIWEVVKIRKRGDII